ncbi:dynamin family protein [Actinomadura alba]|uniref:Dynamin family protein n=1 Tax=Actinomadura alba TaxID=406431 RepID=A0ABR7LPT3_9ACTN|nr:dynamin family protein [Actinomadura alba]MBC6466589.1 dynamin family protein [Actinomadura alba]
MRAGENHLPISATVLAKDALYECAALLPDTGDLSRELSRTLRVAAERLDEPMRLAVVGQIKRGKSTLVNALLGQEVVATARRELTFNVNELHHSAVEQVMLHFRDGRSPASIPPADLADWTVYDSERLNELRTIRKIEFGLDNELLRSFRLIDTPGLGSVHGDDSAATLAKLGIDDPAERHHLQPLLHLLSRDVSAVHRESADELDRADAVLYLFSRGLHEQDRRTLSAFDEGSGSSLTPLKAFGVLTKCDDDWPPDPDGLSATDPLAHHPVEEARERVREYLDEPAIGRIFYTILPVAARVATGAQWLDAERFGWLSELSRLDPVRLVDELSDEGEFGSATDGPVPPAARRELIDRLGGWGVHLACTALRDGLGEEQVRDHLVEQSGVTELRELALRHFGNRSMLIKLNQAVRSVRAELAHYRERIGPDTGLRAAAEQVGRRIERLEHSEHRFAELDALSAHYRGGLTGFSPGEVRQLLEVTGELGTHCAARLALPPDASLGDMNAAVQERIRYWAARANDPILARRSRQVARIIQRSYDGIAERVRLAQRFLEMAD